MSDVTPLTPQTPPKHPETPHMTITNFNYESSYLPGVICNIVVKSDLGRWTPQVIEQRCLQYHYTKIGRQTYFADGSPSELRIDAWNTTTPNLADEPTLANDPPGELKIDALNTTTPNLADEPTFADGP